MSLMQKSRSRVVAPPAVRVHAAGPGRGQRPGRARRQTRRTSRSWPRSPRPRWGSTSGDDGQTLVPSPPQRALQAATSAACRKSTCAPSWPPLPHGRRPAAMVRSRPAAPRSDPGRQHQHRADPAVRRAAGAALSGPGRSAGGGLGSPWCPPGNHGMRRAATGPWRPVGRRTPFRS